MAGEAAPARPGSAKVFACPSCGGQVILRAQGRSLAVSCGSCGSIIDATSENYQVLSKYVINAKIHPLIPLGTRAPFKGDPWEGIGFVVRVTGGLYSWREYLLYNPYKGYRWLTEYDGHWTFVTMIKAPPMSAGGFIKYLDISFKLFQAGDATVQYVLGEFYWRVKVGETVGYADYIAPPFMISSEGDKGEIVWSRAEYVEPEEVRNAFKLPDLPPRFGVGACQPYPHHAELKQMWTFGIGFMTVLLLLQMSAGTHAIVGNLFSCWCLVLLPPGILLWTASNFEQSRWGDSDTSGSDSGDDE